ncbi:MAG: T9SS type A sorting domain-containing protein [Ignavibacteriaceae bacterium]
MKTIFTTAIVIALVVFFTIPSKTLAGGNDTLLVYANGPSLDQVINSDTTTGGMQAHSVYKLATLDTTYIFLGPVSVKSNITVIGVLGTDGRPPCIQSGVLSDGSLPFYLFVMNGANTIGIFKNLYLTGLATNNTINQTNVNGVGALIQISGDYIKLYVDNVVFDSWPENAITYIGNWDDMFITNCKFRNMVSATQWYSGEALRNGGNTAITDSLVMKNNTIFCINAYASGPVTASYIKYFDFSHNSVVLTFQNPFWIFNITNGKVNDNIFYSAWDGGVTIPEYLGMWDQLWSVEVGSLIDLDTLNAAKDTVFDPTDASNPNLKWLAEAKRNIEVKNNVYFWPKAVTDFWTAWDDTAHTDSIYTPTWMDNRTTGMFTDKTHWPNLVESGNQNVDPGYGPSFDKVYSNNTGNGVGMFQYFADIRTNTASTDIYGYQLPSVTGSNWIPAWPLPESVDMQYSNTALKTAGTDGKPVGDPGWFTGGYTGAPKNPTQIPSKFELYQAYPNPFNPSTNIKFTVAQSGNVSLKIFNLMGQLVKTVVDNVYKNKGDYNYQVTMDNLSSGVYFYTLIQGNQQITKKMVLLK